MRKIAQIAQFVRREIARRRPRAAFLQTGVNGVRTA